MKREDHLDVFLASLGLPAVIQLEYYSGPAVALSNGILLACSHNRSIDQCRLLLLKLLRVPDSPAQLCLGRQSKLQYMLGRIRKKEITLLKAYGKQLPTYYSQLLNTERLDISFDVVIPYPPPVVVPPVPRRPYRSSSVPVSRKSSLSNPPAFSVCSGSLLSVSAMPSILSRKPSVVESGPPAPSRSNTADSQGSDFVLPHFPRHLALQHDKEQLQNTLEDKNKRIKLLQAKNKCLHQMLRRRNAARDRAPVKRETITAKKAADALALVKSKKKEVAKLHVQLVQAEEKLEKVKCERDSMRERADYAEDRMCSLEAADGKLIVWDKENNKYSDHVFEHIVKFSQLGVADKKLPNALECAASLAGLVLDRIPSVSTCRRATLMETGLSRVQLEEVLNDPLEAPLTHYSDETTKGGTKIQVHGFSRSKTSDDATHREREVFIIGLAPVQNKSAQTSFECLKDLVSQCSSESAAELFDKYATQVKNVMGDRASTQLKFTEIFELYRESVLSREPEFAALSPSEKMDLTRVNGLFCQIHGVANLATLAEKVCGELDALVLDEVSCRACVFEFLEDIGKYFGPRGSNKYPYYTMWMEWMRAKGKINNLEISPSIPSFIHHRFNISFVIAVRVLYWKDYLLDFIDKVFPQDKHLVEIARSLRSDYILSQLQVLGLIDQSITGPLWRNVLYSSGVSATCRYISVLLARVKEKSESPETFFSDDFRDSTTNSDEFMDVLLSITPGEWGIRLAGEFLQRLQGFIETVYQDYLPGGSFSCRLKEFEKETFGALSHNIDMEAAFGHMDQLFRRMPRMDFTRRAGKLVFSRNGTLKWLEQKTVEERRQIVTRVRKNLPAFQKEMHGRRDALQKLFLKSAIDLQRKNLEKERSTAFKCKKAAEALAIDGFWETVGEMDDKLYDLSSTAQLAALTAQIRFRQLCLHQEMSSDPKFFCLSNNGIPQTSSVLRRKLLALINQGIIRRDCKEGRWLEGWRIQHFFLVNGNKQSFDGHVHSVFETTTGDAWVQLIYDSNPENVLTFCYEEIAKEFEDGDFLLTKYITSS